MSAAEQRLPNFALLLVLAWGLIVLQLMLQYWHQTAITLNDTDDAMRLVQMREYLSGHGWFDLHMSRVQPPTGYDPHWSRLIDAGLAGIFLLFHLFTDTATAERLMRATWPVLWLIPAIAGAAAIAWRIAGRPAALIVLLFAAIGLPAMQQFKPGRIDHHNVQITIALLTAAATVWSDRRRWCAIAAGGLTGLGLAIGFEGAPFLVLCGAAFALRYLCDETAGPALRDYGWSVAASTAIGFLVSVGPPHWGRTECDAIAINSAAAVVIAGLGLAAVGWRSNQRPAMRCGAIAAVAAAAIAVFVWSQPLCLGGPYAMVDPAVKPIWLAHVHEMAPLLSLLHDRPATALGIAAFPAVAVLAVAVLALRRDWRRDFGFQVAGALLVFAVLMMFAAIKMYAYAMWLAMPLVALLALHLFERFRLHALVPRFAVGLLLTPMVLSAGVIGVADAAGLAHIDAGRRAQQRCFDSASYAPLARLPRGLIATDLDYGPFILALTPDSVLAAPYHRLSTGIIAAHRIFASPPDEAHAIIAREHATYVVTCGPHGPVGLTKAQTAASLWGRLHAAHVPNWLTPVPGSAGQAFAIYRVRS